MQLYKPSDKLRYMNISTMGSRLTGIENALQSCMKVRF